MGGDGGGPEWLRRGVPPFVVQREDRRATWHCRALERIARGRTKLAEAMYNCTSRPVVEDLLETYTYAGVTTPGERAGGHCGSFVRVRGIKCQRGPYFAPKAR